MSPGSAAERAGSSQDVILAFDGRTLTSGDLPRWSLNPGTKAKVLVSREGGTFSDARCTNSGRCQLAQAGEKQNNVLGLRVEDLTAGARRAFETRGRCAHCRGGE
jgi:hypothetical protein